MDRLMRLVAIVALIWAAGLAYRPAFAQNPPATTFESMMNSFFGDKNGLVSFTDYDIVFPPKGRRPGSSVNRETRRRAA